MVKYVVKKHEFGPVKALEVGRAWFGRSLMTVFTYAVDGIGFDASLPHGEEPFLQFLQEQNVQRLFLTHYHEDHSGNAASVQNKMRLTVYGPKETAERVQNGFPLLPYQRIVWGIPQKAEIAPLSDKIETERFQFKTIFTPGHSPDHTAYLEANHGWLFSGDLYLSSRIKYFRADESFLQTLKSLRVVARYDFSDLFCGHRPQIGNGKERLLQKLQYFEDLWGEARELFMKGSSENEWHKKMGTGENYFMRWFTSGDLSARNLRKAIWKDVQETLGSNDG